MCRFYKFNKRLNLIKLNVLHSPRGISYNIDSNDNHKNILTLSNKRSSQLNRKTEPKKNLQTFE